jgi:hypothetical protein
METTKMNSSGLTQIAIEALKNAYQDCTSTQTRQFIATAYTAITMLEHVTGISEARNNALKLNDNCDPSEYCAAI